MDVIDPAESQVRVYPSPDGNFVIVHAANTGITRLVRITRRARAIQGAMAEHSPLRPRSSLAERSGRPTPYCLSLDERQTLLAEDLETATSRRKAALDSAYRYHLDSLRPR